MSVLIAKMRLLGFAAFISSLAFLSAGAAHAGALYFPSSKSEWEKADFKAKGFDETALKKVSDYACQTDATDLVVLYEGRIALETHCPLPKKDSVPADFWRVRKGTTASGESMEDVSSMQKSVVSVLIGMAAGKKILDVDKPASIWLGKGWTKATPEQEEAITLRHLLSMASGLDEKLGYEEQPGTFWRYNTTAYSRLIFVLEKATGKSIQHLSEEWLFKPIGMTSSRWNERSDEQKRASPWGSPFGFETTARDYARLDLLVLNKGMWNGKDILHNPGWIEQSTRPSQDSNPSYGYLWWLNGQKFHKNGRGRLEAENGPLIKSAPADLFAGLGAGDRKIYIVPGRSLVVTRFGAPAGGDTFSFKFWHYLMKALPQQ